MVKLYGELLYEELGRCLIENFELLQFDYEKIMKERAIQILNEIREVIRDTALDDFEVVEEIVCIFEKYDIDADFRHDFG